MTAVQYLRAEASRWRAEAAIQRLPAPATHSPKNNPVAVTLAVAKAEALEEAAEAIERGRLV